MAAPASRHQREIPTSISTDFRGEVGFRDPKTGREHTYFITRYRQNDEGDVTRFYQEKLGSLSRLDDPGPSPVFLSSLTRASTRDWPYLSVIRSSRKERFVGTIFLTPAEPAVQGLAVVPSLMQNVARKANAHIWKWVLGSFFPSLYHNRITIPLIRANGEGVAKQSVDNMLLFTVLKEEDEATVAVLRQYGFTLIPVHQPGELEEGSVGYQISARELLEDPPPVRKRFKILPLLEVRLPEDGAHGWFKIKPVQKEDQEELSCFLIRQRETLKEQMRVRGNAPSPMESDETIREEVLADIDRPSGQLCSFILRGDDGTIDAFLAVNLLANGEVYIWPNVRQTQEFLTYPIWSWVVNELLPTLIKKNQYVVDFREENGAFPTKGVIPIREAFLFATTPTYAAQVNQMFQRKGFEKLSENGAVVKWKIQIGKLVEGGGRAAAAADSC